MDIKPGSVVMLKSGSHEMVVVELGEHHDAKCIWFNEGELKEQWLALVVLTEVPQMPRARGKEPVKLAK